MLSAQFGAVQSRGVTIIASSLFSSLIVSDEILSDINSLSEILGVDLTALYNVTLIDKFLVELFDKSIWRKTS